MPETGFEPATYRLRNDCSIRMSFTGVHVASHHRLTTFQGSEKVFKLCLERKLDVATQNVIGHV
jgi:hypothetical protein